jgi:Flp pilus assembly pilin Flp
MISPREPQQGGAATPRSKGRITSVAVVKRHRQEVPNKRRSHSPLAGNGRFSVDMSRPSTAREEVNREMFQSYSEWLDFAKVMWRKQEGQTMAEYGVVLAVITIGAVGVFTALSGGISKSINKVTGLLP